LEAFEAGFEVWNSKAAAVKCRSAEAIT